ncbi:tyrosine-type recombinase/integrase [Micromonospora sp. NPDC000442]|uniref:tyrosine-type recombinase/integrase n=1 Tax=Micromonospora sp. NPDC000442 TaxID=3364217 RepID=UPI0036C4E35D
MPLLDLQKLTVGLSRAWAGFLRDWDRSLRAGNYPETTRYNYLLAAAQLGRYLGDHSPDPDAADAAEDPCAVTRAHVEAFQGWMIETRSASTAVNKHKGLQQFFKWLLLDEEAIDRSPMQRVRQPKTPRKLIPVMRDEDTSKLLDACKGKGFANLRDEALIRVYCNTGARLSEVGNLLAADVDLNTESVRFHGKGAKDRRVRFGPKTARALSRYLRARDKHKGCCPAAPVAGRARHRSVDSERHQDPAQTAGRRGRGGGRARPPVAAQLRPRVETPRRRHR